MDDPTLTPPSVDPNQVTPQGDEAGSEAGNSSGDASSQERLKQQLQGSSNEALRQKTRADELQYQLNALHQQQNQQAQQAQEAPLEAKDVITDQQYADAIMASDTNIISAYTAQLKKQAADEITAKQAVVNRQGAEVQAAAAALQQAGAPLGSNSGQYQDEIMARYNMLRADPTRYLTHKSIMYQNHDLNAMTDAVKQVVSEKNLNQNQAGDSFRSADTNFSAVPGTQGDAQPPGQTVKSFNAEVHLSSEEKAGMDKQRLSYESLWNALDPRNRAARLAQGRSVSNVELGIKEKVFSATPKT